MMSVLEISKNQSEEKPKTARELAQSLVKKGLFGCWADIVPADTDSIDLARKIRSSQSRL